MLTFSKSKTFMVATASIISVAFLLASITMFFQNQPSNTTFICLISALLAGAFAIILAIDIRQESKTMKAEIVIKQGLPVSIVSQDIEEVYLLDLNNRLKRKKLTNREITAHVIHYYEKRKAAGIIHSDTKLQVIFTELDVLKPVMMPYTDEGDIIIDEKDMTMVKADSLAKHSEKQSVQNI